MKPKIVCLFKQFCCILFLFIQLTKINASLLKNGVVGEPRVECGVESIGVKIRTKQDFHGRLYVEEESEHSDCVHSYAIAASKNHYDSRIAEFNIRFGQCNMRRQRILNPRGVSYSFTLVISFHPIFLTGVDKAFHIKCFFLEAVKAVDIALDVNPLTTITVEREFSLPRCTYHLKQEPNGPHLKFASIGEPITHVWECDSVAGSVYGILIHSCYVDDGRDNRFDLVDERGCAIDHYLLDDIAYNEKGLGAFVSSHVFRYADRIQLFFTCTLQLCFKADGGCSGITPPTCSITKGRAHRGKHEHPPSRSHTSSNVLRSRHLPIPPGVSVPRELYRKSGNGALGPIFNRFSSSDKRASPVGTTSWPPEETEEPNLFNNSYKDSPLNNETDSTLNGTVRTSRETIITNMETDLSADLTVLPLHDVRAGDNQETTIKITMFNNNSKIAKNQTMQTTTKTIATRTHLPPQTVNQTKIEEPFEDTAVESETPKLPKLNPPLAATTLPECMGQQNLIALTVIFIVTVLSTTALTSLICIKKQEQKLSAFCFCLKFFRKNNFRNNYRY